MNLRNLFIPASSIKHFLTT